MPSTTTRPRRKGAPSRKTPLRHARRSEPHEARRSTTSLSSSLHTEDSR